MLAPGTLAIVCAVVFAAAVLRGLTGFGFALAAVPLMSLAVAPEKAVTVTILLQAIIGLRDIVQLRRLVDWRSFRKLCIGALIGTAPGIYLLAMLDPSILRILLAAIVCASLPFLLNRPSEVTASTGRFAVPAGILSGFFGGAAAMPGPPAITYFLHLGSPAAVMRASLMIFFFVTSTIALPGLFVADLLGSDTLVAALVAFPFMLIGTTTGGHAFSRASESLYKRVCVVLLVVIALVAGARGIVGLL